MQSFDTSNSFETAKERLFSGSCFDEFFSDNQPLDEAETSVCYIERKRDTEAELSLSRIRGCGFWLVVFDAAQQHYSDIVFVYRAVAQSLLRCGYRETRVKLLKNMV